MKPPGVIPQVGLGAPRGVERGLGDPRPAFERSGRPVEPVGPLAGVVARDLRLPEPLAGLVGASGLGIALRFGACESDVEGGGPVAGGSDLADGALALGGAFAPLPLERGVRLGRASFLRVALGPKVFAFAPSVAELDLQRPDDVAERLLALAGGGELRIDGAPLDPERLDLGLEALGPTERPLSLESGLGAGGLGAPGQGLGRGDPIARHPLPFGNDRIRRGPGLVGQHRHRRAERPVERGFRTALLRSHRALDEARGEDLGARAGDGRERAPVPELAPELGPGGRAADAGDEAVEGGLDLLWGQPGAAALGSPRRCHGGRVRRRGCGVGRGTVGTVVVSVDGGVGAGRVGRGHGGAPTA